MAKFGEYQSVDFVTPGPFDLDSCEAQVLVKNYGIFKFSKWKSGLCLVRTLCVGIEFLNGVRLVSMKANYDRILVISPIGKKSLELYNLYADYKKSFPAFSSSRNVYDFSSDKKIIVMEELDDEKLIEWSHTYKMICFICPAWFDYVHGLLCHEGPSVEDQKCSFVFEPVNNIQERLPIVDASIAITWTSTFSKNYNLRKRISLSLADGFVYRVLEEKDIITADFFDNLETFLHLLKKVKCV